MGIKVIAMLTNNDQTVKDALEIFEKNQFAKTECWGFKDIGIKTEDAIELVAAMKKAGKTTFLEPLLEEEENCINVAKLAVKCGFDYVINMTYNQKANKILTEGGVKYLPTCGKREGLPRLLYGTQEEITEDAENLMENEGVEGVCLSAYRYQDGDPEKMALHFRKHFSGQLIVSGGINTFARLDFVKKLQPWGFTIGSALFSHKFGAELSIAQQLDIIQEYIN